MKIVRYLWSEGDGRWRMVSFSLKMNLISWTGTAKRPLRASRGMHVALGRPAPYRGFYKVHTSLFHAYRIVLLLRNFILSIRLRFKVDKDSFKCSKVHRWTGISEGVSLMCYQINKGCWKLHLVGITMYKYIRTIFPGQLTQAACPSALMSPQRLSC